MSNTKYASTRTGAVAMAGLVLAASILAAVTLMPSVASAQEIQREEKLERRLERPSDVNHRQGLHSVMGSGIATDQETGENYRSGFRFIVQKVNGTENEFEVKRGVIGLFVDGKRVHYTAVPDSWSVILSDDRLTFKASGKVENGDAAFEVTLTGHFGMNTRLGTVWSIHGEMEGRETSYDLHYVGISHGARAAAIQ